MKEKFSFFKDKKNRKIIINIVAVIALLCIAVGISFAGGYWSYTSSNDNTLESGSVSLTYLESTSEINLTNALPMSDKDGKLLSKKGAKFEFAVTTNSDYSQVINYDINIEPLVVDTGLTGLDPSAVKVYLEDKEGNQLVSPVKLSELNNFNLYSTKHTHKKGGTKITSKYVLKAWIDKDVVASDWYKEYKNNNTKYQYKFRVNVNGEGAEYIDNSLDKSGANAPVLDEGMIPVYYDEVSETWKKADQSNESKDYKWYDYNNKMWANSVTVSSANRETYKRANVGTEIPMDDILTMEVWIPRYKYKVFNYNSDGTKTSSPQQIEITFEKDDKNTSEILCSDSISGTDGKASETCKLKSTNATCTDSLCNNKTYTHPAFTFGNEEIKGFWIGKFELTGTISSITTKPNLSSIRNQSVSTFETNIMNMKNIGNQYGLNTTTDTHMIKNSEWGAVAYLSHSKYGTCTDGTCSEVNINNSSGMYTGRSGGAPGGSTAINTVYTDKRLITQYNRYGFYTYDGYLLDYNTNTKSTTKDMSKVASTTHNIYGVYDMSGGAYEYTMANMVSNDGTTMMSGYSSSSNSGYTGKIYDSGNYIAYAGVDYPNNKYYDKYSFSTSDSTRIRSKLGEGIKEVYTGNEGWYSDISYLAYSDSPWFRRGGSYYDGESAGAFHSVGDSGNADSYSSRLVITP